MTHEHLLDDRTAILEVVDEVTHEHHLLLTQQDVPRKLEHQEARVVHASLTIDAIDVVATGTQLLGECLAVDREACTNLFLDRQRAAAIGRRRQRRRLDDRVRERTGHRRSSRRRHTVKGRQSLQQLQQIVGATDAAIDLTDAIRVQDSGHQDVEQQFDRRCLEVRVELLQIMVRSRRQQRAKQVFGPQMGLLLAVALEQVRVALHGRIGISIAGDRHMVRKLHDTRQGILDVRRIDATNVNQCIDQARESRKSPRKHDLRRLGGLWLGLGGCRV